MECLECGKELKTTANGQICENCINKIFFSTCPSCASEIFLPDVGIDHVNKDKLILTIKCDKCDLVFRKSWRSGAVWIPRAGDFEV